MLVKWYHIQLYSLTTRLTNFMPLAARSDWAPQAAHP